MHFVLQPELTPYVILTPPYPCILPQQRSSVQTRSAITSFFLAMTVYPEVQRKAQVELDKVIGRSRLPSFEDRANLPYIEAIVKEVHRWLPVAALGDCLPHLDDWIPSC